MAYNRINYIKKSKLIAELAAMHYEPERQDRSYKAVWRRWIVPIYPMSYQTFMRHLHCATKKLPPIPPSTQLSLFE